MKIVEPWAHIRFATDTDGIWLLQRVELIARNSHRTEEKVTADSWENFCRKVVLNHGDWSVTEHISVTVEAEVDRGITHEWVRHRIGAYTQESTRFVDYSKPEHEPRYIRPLGLTEDQLRIWEMAIYNADATYQRLLVEGAPPQLARSVLPNSLASRLIVTYNLRMWRHFFLMRTSKEAHPQMKQVTIPLLEEFQRMIPILYEDIVPNQHQSANLRMTH